MAYQKKINQQKIADRLNVSVATVSKALRNQSDISQSVRELVQKTAHELGYRSQRRSRPQRRRSRSRFVGLFLHHPLDGGVKNAPTFLGGMSQITNDINVSLVVQTFSYHADLRQVLKRQSQPPAMREGNLAGLALGGDWPADIVLRLQEQYQVVVFPYPIPGVHVDMIGFDNASVMLELVTRLRQLGHQRIGFMGKCGKLAWASERYAGFAYAMERLGASYQPEWVVDVDETRLYNEGYEDVWRGLVDHIESVMKHDGVYAWICSSDWPAYQLFRGMLDRGYRIPDDLSITGFDDTEPITLGCPPVTSVCIPRNVMGQAILKRLVNRIDHPNSDIRQLLFRGEVVDHGTIGAPPRTTGSMGTLATSSRTI